MSHALAAAATASPSTASTAAHWQAAAFWVLFVIAVLAAIGMIVTRRAVHCAVLLAIVMLILAAMYAMQGAPFLAFVQIIVYTGAVLMLFLFVLMIVGITAADSVLETLRGQRLWAGLAGIGLGVLLILVVGHAAIGPAAPAGPRNGQLNLDGIAALIFTRYVFPFEATSALLITAALGAMVLTHRERISPRPTQRMLSRQRVASGRPAPLAGPGTLARHNGVDTPALLPDGSRLEIRPGPEDRAGHEREDEQPERALVPGQARALGEARAPGSGEAAEAPEADGEDER